MSLFCRNGFIMVDFVSRIVVDNIYDGDNVFAAKSAESVLFNTIPFGKTNIYDCKDSISSWGVYSLIQER